MRRLSGLPLPVESDGPGFGIDVAIVCALEQPEFDAVKASFGGASKWRETGNARYTHLYREAELMTQAGQALKVVATTSSSMGLTAASIATTQLQLN